MFKAKVEFTTGDIQYMLVAGYDENQATDTILDEFCGDEIECMTMERVSDAPNLVVVAIDPFEQIEEIC